MGAKYDKPTQALMRDFASKHLSAGQVFGKEPAVRWFAENYPKINPTTVKIHMEAMSVNSRNRMHYPNIKPTSGHDLFLKIGKGQYRLWDPTTDPAPVYATTLAQAPSVEVSEDLSDGDATEAEERRGSETEFALEAHLRDYLARNLGLLEPGLHLYEEEGITGIEFPVGGRFIDILAVDRDGSLVAVELKVSRGYDRTVGQLLRYMGWLENNLANGKQIRGIIVASQITDDLRLACSRIVGVTLAEYELSMKLKPVMVRA